MQKLLQTFAQQCVYILIFTVQKSTYCTVRLINIFLFSDIFLWLIQFSLCSALWDSKTAHSKMKCYFFSTHSKLFEYFINFIHAHNKQQSIGMKPWFCSLFSSNCQIVRLCQHKMSVNSSFKAPDFLTNSGVYIDLTACILPPHIKRHNNKATIQYITIVHTGFNL